MTTNAFHIQLAGLAQAFRLGLSVQASMDLSDLMNPISAHIANLPADRLQQISVVVAEILRCQQNKDWLGMADYLEFELAELLTNA